MARAAGARGAQRLAWRGRADVHERVVDPEAHAAGAVDEGRGTVDKGRTQPLASWARGGMRRGWPCFSQPWPEAWPVLQLATMSEGGHSWPGTRPASLLTSMVGVGALPVEAAT